MKYLVIIPARGGSKGIPGKNIKPLDQKPLIQYSIETALQICENIQDICLSTDSPEIIAFAETMGLKVHFTRPQQYSTDEASSQSVIIHALEYYKKHFKKKYDAIVLLQPTSPFRKKEDIFKMLDMYNNEIDMVVSVKVGKENPYYTLYEQDEQGYLIQSKQSNYTTRQECPKVYVMNGSVYVINVQSLLKKEMNDFALVVKYEMEDIFSIDIDSMLDWMFAETLLKNNLFK